MNTKKVLLISILIIFFIIPQCYSQIIEQPCKNKLSFSLNNGGYWKAYNYGLKNLNYNITLQGEYKINKSIATVINTGFNFQHFNEKSISIEPSLNTPASTKLVMIEFTTGINYYIPLQKKTNGFLTTNLGYYHERFFIPSVGDISSLQFKNVDDNWSGNFGLNGGIGIESYLFKNINWTFLTKYHYIFSSDENMKFLNVNIGLKYNF